MSNINRVTLASVVCALALLVGSSSAEAQSRSSRFGIGGMVGDPFGLTMKLRLGDVMALDFGVGWEAWGYGDRGDDSFQLHMDFVWAIDLASLRRTEMAFYVGVGPQIQFDDDDRDGDYDDSYIWFGARVPLGLVWDFKQRNLDVFVEVVPGFLFGEHDYWNDGDGHLWFETDFSAGARYWF
jgi:hypothetical protein